MFFIIVCIILLILLPFLTLEVERWNKITCGEQKFTEQNPRVKPKLKTTSIEKRDKKPHKNILDFKGWTLIFRVAEMRLSVSNNWQITT